MVEGLTGDDPGAVELNESFAEHSFGQFFRNRELDGAFELPVRVAAYGRLVSKFWQFIKKG